MLQNNFDYATPAVRIGDLVKPKEPNDLESIIVGKDVIVGHWVQKVLDDKGNEVIEPMWIDDKEKLNTLYSTVFGIAINSIDHARKETKFYEKEKWSTEELENGDYPKKPHYTYRAGEVAVVGRTSSKLSVVPELMIPDGTTEEEILTSQLCIIVTNDPTSPLNGITSLLSSSNTYTLEDVEAMQLALPKTCILRKTRMPQAYYLENSSNIIKMN